MDNIRLFMGPWYEIARLYNKGDNPISDARIALYLDNHAIHMCDTCLLHSKIKRAVFSTARETGVGKIRVARSPFLPARLFYTDLSILQTDYVSFALVSMGSQLRILSRTRQINPTIYTSLEDRARAEGFPVDRLRLTPHFTPAEIV